ncbi:hypothetical protein HELRODRAFT_72558 [Helobdella robusta]|uniref:Fatty acyl-CoA reductase n=1 Tax=Helobdella robusta TaxID=6412 RepID=T1G118_HELRO|nr:hypothetical protein HELRODRAFT_72558 [Helobdella robusta]ESO10774.1 hypothetical protein HELRODRAFT_72558 [Helobdella robusta]
MSSSDIDNSIKNIKISNSGALGNDDEQSEIANYYAGKTIFITGASGFIGKQVLEKLLRSCGGVKAIYVLMRSTKRHTSSERLQLMLNSKLFHRMTELDGELVNKVFVLEGDISKPHLGLRDADIQKIISQVNVVFHLAATVSFTEPMRVAVSLNIVGLRSMLELCKQIQHLQALVHVSTAYANCTRSHIEETIYPPPVFPKKILHVAEWMSDDVFQLITPMVLEKHPNTYTFTKSIAETLLIQERGTLPVAIYRPSIVTASFQEPFPGWVDNLNGATGVLTAVGSGFLKSVYGIGSLSADLVPVDLVANSIIAVGWKLASQKNPSSEVPVYNFTSGTRKPITWNEVGIHLTDIFRRFPMDNPTSIPKAFVTNNRLTHAYFLRIEIFLRLMALDFIRRLCGHKPRLLRIHGNVIRLMNVMEYFTSNEWTWSTDNVDKLYGSMNRRDRQLFNFDLRRVHWPTYLESYCIGIRQYTLHQDLKNLPTARKTLKWLLIARRLMLITSFLALFRIFVGRFEVISSMWRFFTSFIYGVFNKMPWFIKAR